MHHPAAVNIHNRTKCVLHCCVKYSPSTVPSCFKVSSDWMQSVLVLFAQICVCDCINWQRVCSVAVFMLLLVFMSFIWALTFQKLTRNSTFLLFLRSYSPFSSLFCTIMKWRLSSFVTHFQLLWMCQATSIVFIYPFASKGFTICIAYRNLL